MLHAVNRRKARLNAFRGAGERVPLEDVITSSVFGALSLLRSEDQQEALRYLFREMGAPLPDWAGVPRIALWPQRTIAARGLRNRYIEPDVEITDGSGAILLIEVKWGAALSTNELSAQWLSLSPGSRARSRHLLLVLEPASYRETVSDERTLIRSRTGEDWTLQSSSWRDVAQACRLMAADPALEQSIRSWAQQVHLFLMRENPHALQGWDNLKLANVSPSSWRFDNPWFTDVAPVSSIQWKVRENA